MGIRPPLPPSVPTKPDAESILCYRLVDPISVVAQTEKLGSVAFGIKQGSSDGPFFAILQDRMQMIFGNSKAGLQEQSPSGVPSTAAQAEVRARQVLESASRAAAAAGITEAINAQMLFPDELLLINAAPVFHPETMQIDHWLTLFQPALSTGSQKGSMPVVDSAIEIRIGGPNQLVGLIANWWPISQSAVCSPIAPPDIRDLSWSAAYQERAGFPTDDVDQNVGNPALCYARAADNNGPVNWVAPYFVFPGDPLQNRYSAARYPSA